LKYARKLLQHPHYFHLAQAEHIPFRSNSFDGIVARGIIHHLESPADGLREMGRVLQPGGKLVIFEGDPRALYRIVSLGLAERMGKQHELTQFYHRSYKEIQAFVTPWAEVRRLRVAGIFAPFSYVGFGNKTFWRVAELVRTGIQKTVPALFGWWNLIVATKRS
jgi:ubiquinone/menaquinone biosynthesis C-methylase UbiE